jgi:hypothetical protein
MLLNETAQIAETALPFPQFAQLHSVTCVPLWLRTILGNYGCIAVSSLLGVPSGLKQLDWCRDSFRGFRDLKILIVYSLYIQETILYAKEMCKCIVNKQVHTYNARNNDYHRYVHNLDLYNS